MNRFYRDFEYWIFLAVVAFLAFCIYSQDTFANAPAPTPTASASPWEVETTTISHNIVLRIEPDGRAFYLKREVTDVRELGKLLIEYRRQLCPSYGTLLWTNDSVAAPVRFGK